LNTENEGTGVRESNGERKSAEGKEKKKEWCGLTKVTLQGTN